MNERYILIGQTAVPCPDLKEWAHWFESTESRDVAFTLVGPVYVSTLFFGLDMRFTYNGPPLLFETMAWTTGTPPHQNCDCLECRDPRDFLDVQERCSTWLEAEQQHARIVAAIAEQYPGQPIEALHRAV
jgi:hypothetical protein